MSEAQVKATATVEETQPSDLLLRNAALFVLAFFGMAALLGGVLWVSVFGWPKWQHGFDSEDWRAASGAPYQNDDRWFMIDDLLHEHTLKGLDHVRLEALLGPPDSEPYLLEEQPRHAGAHIYHLGPDHLGLDSMWLVVTWDNEGHVADAIVVSD